MTAKSLMIQGTGSDVGKSVIVAGLCRAARNLGINVAPFKPQNMSNNAAACRGGGEIGRAQALQAMAAGLDPHTDHNPVLLKPETDRVAQVVVHGRPLASMEAATYMGSRDDLLEPVLESFNRLRTKHELILVEGAGSPAETNLRERDIANMGFAVAADVPVCLLGDIERGGVIASIVGTHTVLEPEDLAMVAGFAINKFRGDPALFDNGVTDIEERTGWPCFGVIPWLHATSKLPAEDAVSALHAPSAASGALRVVAPMLSRMANFDDADPLRMDPNVNFSFVPPGQPLPSDADLVILFGTKSTLGDLNFLRSQGWDSQIVAHAKRGGRVLGICGGYQMLGTEILDESGVDGVAGTAAGLGLLDVATTMSRDKMVQPVAATCADSGVNVSGYEIHMGRTTGPDTSRPLLRVSGEPEGARNEAGNVEGTYLHGLLVENAYRMHFLARMGVAADDFDYRATVDSALDELATDLEKALDVDRLFEFAR